MLTVPADPWLRKPRFCLQPAGVTQRWEAACKTPDRGEDTMCMSELPSALIVSPDRMASPEDASSHSDKAKRKGHRQNNLQAELTAVAWLPQIYFSVCKDRRLTQTARSVSNGLSGPTRLRATSSFRRLSRSIAIRDSTAEICVFRFYAAAAARLEQKIAKQQNRLQLT